MKIYCRTCKCLVGNVLSGSTLKRDLSYQCAECTSRSKIAEDLADLAHAQADCNTVGSDMPDFFKDIFMKGKTHGN